MLAICFEKARRLSSILDADEVENAKPKWVFPQYQILYPNVRWAVQIWLLFWSNYSERVAVWMWVSFAEYNTAMQIFSSFLFEYVWILPKIGRPIWCNSVSLLSIIYCFTRMAPIQNPIADLRHFLQLFPVVFSCSSNISHLSIASSSWSVSNLEIAQFRTISHDLHSYECHLSHLNMCSHKPTEWDYAYDLHGKADRRSWRQYLLDNFNRFYDTAKNHLLSLYTLGEFAYAELRKRSQS